MNAITKFDGEYQFLSNFWICQVQYNGLIYPSSENAYQASKLMRKTQKKIFTTATPARAKRMIHNNKEFGLTLDPDFHEYKLGIMFDILLVKFREGSWERHLLDQTGDAELIEGNTWNDTFWGVCNGTGENHLGKILMRIRGGARS